MTEVYCRYYDCVNRGKSGVCTLDEIVIDVSSGCVEYEPRDGENE